MNTLLSTIGATIGGAGILAASILPSSAVNTAKTVSNAEKNQSTITNYMDNQGNSGYTRHNRANMDQAWNYFNPSNYQGSNNSSNPQGSTSSDAKVNPGGPMSTGAGTDSSTTTGASGTSTTGSTTTTTGTPDSSSTTDMSTKSSAKMPQIPSPFRHMIMADVTKVLHQIKAHWRSNDSNRNWTPTGANWQADWSNWNPILWEQHGSTYANWAKQFGAYLSARFPSFASEIKQVGL